MALPIKRNPTIAADVGSGTSPEVPTTFKVMKSELPLEPHEIVCVPGVIFSVEKLLPSNVEEAGPIVEIPEITDPVGTMMELKPVNPMTFPVLLVETLELNIGAKLGVIVTEPKV
jgi:hypothetical protein